MTVYDNRNSTVSGHSCRMMCPLTLLLVAGIFAGATVPGIARADVQLWEGDSLYDPNSMTAQAESDSTLDARLRRLSPLELDEVLWLARCIYSESDRPHEQELVAWVVRNRVETGYRGRTYREVVLEDRQFSAFNDPTPRRARILALDASSRSAPWRTALAIALDVYQAGPGERPFAQTVRHFYSPISMTGFRSPYWADADRELSSADLGVDPFRFRFYDNINEEAMAASSRSIESDLDAPKPTRIQHDDGFLMPTMKTSGRVARPRRPVVRPARNSR